MKFVDFLPGFVAALSLVAGPSSAVAVAVQDNGINVEAYCNYNHDESAVLLNEQDAYTWRCTDGSSISMDLACRQQYGEDWASALGNRRDAYSWYCYQQGD